MSEKKKRSKASIRHQIVRVILDVLTALTLTTALLFSFITHFLLNEKAYKDIILSEDFNTAALAGVRENLSNIGSVVEISADTIINSVSEERIIAYEREYTVAYLNYVMNGTPLDVTPINTAKLKTEIYDEIRAYCDEQQIVFSEEETEEIYEYACGSLNASLNYVPKLISDRLPAVERIVSIFRMLSVMELPLYLCAALLFAANLSIGWKRHRNDVCFGTVSASWICVCTILAPLAIVYFYDVPSRLILAESALFYLAKGVCELLFRYSTMMFTLGLAVLTVLLIVTMVIKAKQHHHHHHGSFRAVVNEEDGTVGMKYVVE